MTAPAEESDLREAARLQALATYDVLDTPRAQAFSDLVRLATRLCDAPTAVLTLVDRDRQWFKAEIGLGFRETPRTTSFCAHTIEKGSYFEVVNANLEERFADNPFVA